MARKIKPSLVDVDSVVFAVLSPGVGFLKQQYGEFYFYDTLPRASGCYVTYDEADARRTEALEKTYAKWQEALKKEYVTDYRINQNKKVYDAAMNARVVKITWD